MRQALVERKTKETQISVSLCLDGGEVSVDTGIGFFDHMLTAFGVHGGFGLEIKCKGDLNVDGHHTAEDVGIVLGKAFEKALGDKGSIDRYGNFFVPMDEALAFCSVDVSGRPFLVFNAQFPQQKIGDFDACLCKEFFRALAFNAGFTMHLKAEYGENSHHIAEGLFKAAAHAVKLAVKSNDGGVLSTKGSID